MKNWRFICSLMLLAGLWASGASAQEAVSAVNTVSTVNSSAIGAENPWIILGGISRHTCRDCGFRESNPGLAVQWSPKWLTDYMESDKWRLSAGGYINSNNRNSVYVGAIWQPMEYGSDAVNMKVGVQAAIITNYKEKAILPTLLPVISLETPHAGVDIFLVPKFPSVSAAVLLSFKVKY